MESFLLFFERKIRNPLRKKELEREGIPNNKEWVDSESKKLEPDEKRELRNLSRRRATKPEDIQSYKQQIENEKKQKLGSEYLKGKSFQDLKLLYNIRNVRIYADQYVSNLKESKEDMRRTVVFFLKYYKDIVPIRGFDIIITNSDNNPKFAKLNNVGGGASAAAYYVGNKVYIDEQTTTDSRTLLHEYAHLLADRVAKQVEPVLKREYDRMINSIIKDITGKRNRRKTLEGEKHLGLRRQIVKKLKIPDPSELGYAATNFDEWFAVIIENWKFLPNNKHTYNFKRIFKKIINRL